MNHAWRAVPRETERNDFMVMATMIRAMKREGKCRVYWGQHSCNEDGWHFEEHQCACGGKPHSYSVMWGQDLTVSELMEMRERQKHWAGMREWSRDTNQRL